jgi:uncharacterized protein (TIGR00255 family)
MIFSMTGFARTNTATDWGALQWELRSVNHRYLEVAFRIPENLRNLELPLRDLVRAKLKRGKVDCTLRLTATRLPAHLDINRPVLLQLLSTLEQLRRDAPDASHPDPLDLLRWPGVLSESKEEPEAFERVARSTFLQALEVLATHRAREGAELGSLITERLREIDAVVAELRTMTATLAEELHKRLLTRIREVMTEVPQDRLAQEVALLVQRADVAEELDRLELHAKEARSMLAADGPHGRRLDFLAQELNREANTLAAKSTLARAAQRAVDLKVAIEQIREQVQNIE